MGAFTGTVDLQGAQFCCARRKFQIGDLSSKITLIYRAPLQDGSGFSRDAFR
jgi:hypothetical protein